MGKYDNCQCEACRLNKTLNGLSCESPIERQFAEALMLYTDGKSGLRLKAQYELGRYRFDFAILDDHLVLQGRVGERGALRRQVVAPVRGVGIEVFFR